MTRRVIAASIWTIVVLAAITWLALGNLSTEFGPLVAALVGVLLAYGPARVVAWWRMAREEFILPRVVPLRIGAILSGLVMFGPLVAAAAGWDIIIFAAVSFMIGLIMLCLVTALFSDGYQGFWLDSIIFRNRLNPPEDDWLVRRDVNRKNSR